MSKSRDPEVRSWADEESDGEDLVREMKRAIERLREQFSDFHECVSHNDNADEVTPAD